MDSETRFALRIAARENAVARGCTCGPTVGLVEMEPGPCEDYRVGVLHFVACPLYRPPGELPAEPDARMKVRR